MHRLTIASREPSTISFNDEEPVFSSEEGEVFLTHFNTKLQRWNLVFTGF